MAYWYAFLFCHVSCRVWHCHIPLGEGRSTPFPDFSIAHCCKDFDAMYEWTRLRSSTAHSTRSRASQMVPWKSPYRHDSLRRWRSLQKISAWWFITISARWSGVVFSRTSTSICHDAGQVWSCQRGSNPYSQGSYCHLFIYHSVEYGVKLLIL